MRFTNIPVQLASLILDKKLYKAFAIYLQLKFHNDKIHGSELASILQADKRTYTKHLKTLLELNWIGYNARKDVYHVRGFNYIRTSHELKRRRATLLLTQDIKNIQTFLAASIICSSIMDQEYYKRPGTVTKKRGVTKQSQAFSYLGLSNYKIAKILGCKQTRARVLKLKAKRLGYINTKKQLQFVSDDPNYREGIADIRPIDAMRLRLIQGKVYRQLPDEILPNLQFRKLKKLCLQKSATDSRGC